MRWTNFSTGWYGAGFNDRERRYLKTVKTNGKVVSLRRVEKVGEPSEADLGKLGRLISAYAPHDGSFELRVPGVHAIRFSRVNQECVHALRLPSLCIATQGAKTIIVGQDLFEYDATRMIVFSVALPVAAQVTRASQSEPYLALKLDLDPHKIAELALKVFPHGLPSAQERIGGLRHFGRGQRCQCRDEVDGMPRATRRC